MTFKIIANPSPALGRGLKNPTSLLPFWEKGLGDEGCQSDQDPNLDCVLIKLGKGCKDLSKLLLLGCSQRKKLDKGLLPAIDRYDGPAYRVVRRYLRQGSNLPLDISILSGKYGLISANDHLPYYDHRIPKDNLIRLHHQIMTKLETILHAKAYTKLLICMGSDYTKAISGYQSIIPDRLTVQVATGGMGRKLSILYDWLYGDSSNLEKNPDPIVVPGVVRLRGIEINLTREQVLDIARAAIVKHDRSATNYQSWYVPVDDQRVAPKWLVSQITKLPVGSFHTHSAKKILQQLGIPVLLERQV